MNTLVASSGQLDVTCSRVSTAALCREAPPTAVLSCGVGRDVLALAGDRIRLLVAQNIS